MQCFQLKKLEYKIYHMEHLQDYSRFWSLCLFCVGTVLLRSQLFVGKKQLCKNQRINIDHLIQIQLFLHKLA